MTPAASSAPSRHSEREFILQRFRHYPDLTFHYGLSWREIADMPRWLRQIYADELPRLVAQRQQEAITAASFPQMKKGDRASITRKLERAARGGRESRAEEVEVDTDKTLFEQKMASLGIGVEEVPPDA